MPTKSHDELFSKHRTPLTLNIFILMGLIGPATAQTNTASDAGHEVHGISFSRILCVLLLLLGCLLVLSMMHFILLRLHPEARGRRLTIARLHYVEPSPHPQRTTLSEP